jgi:hypothetical protein
MTRMEKPLDPRRRMHRRRRFGCNPHKLIELECKRRKHERK